MLERLTYLLGICVAVITWGMGQLISQLTADKVVAYSLSSDENTDGASRSSLVTENISRKEALDGIEITAIADKTNCIKRFIPRTDGVAGIIDQAPIVDPDGTAGRVSLGQFLPGGRYKFIVEHAPACTVQFQVKPSQGVVRVVARGLETFTIKNQFHIVISLVAAFAIVFVITYLQSIRVAGRGT